MTEDQTSDSKQSDESAAPSDWWARVPAMAAFSRVEGRKDSGRLDWLLTPGELRYLIAVAAFVNREGFCNTPLRTIAKRMSVSPSLASRWEKAIANKGFATVTRKLRVKNGRWKCRVLKLLYPGKLVRADGSMAPVPTPVRPLPSRKKKKLPDEALTRNETNEPLEVNRSNVVPLVNVQRFKGL